MAQRRPVDPDRYTGRRRLPKLPGKRYASVVATAFVGALLVAAFAGVALPDKSTGLEAMTVMDPVNAMDQRNRTVNLGGAQAAIDQAAAEVWKVPVNPNECSYSVTSGFAEYREGFGWHYGIDLACPGGSSWGKDMYAAHSGQVIIAEKEGDDGSGYGRYVVIYHGPDENGDEIVTVYGHASKVVVNAGDRVTAGQLIAYIGDTGQVSGAHLHFEVDTALPPVTVNHWPNLTDHLNPKDYLQPRGVDLYGFKSAANGDDVNIDVTDGRANPSSSASASAQPSGSASPR